jgi:hypothetical protein
MTQDELKLVFDALKQCNSYAFAGGLGLRATAHRDALAILEKAIAELESQETVAHWSDCAVHSEPAYPKGECDCGGYTPSPQRKENT